MQFAPQLCNSKCVEVCGSFSMSCQQLSHDFVFENLEFYVGHTVNILYKSLLLSKQTWEELSFFLCARPNTRKCYKRLLKCKHEPGYHSLSQAPANKLSSNELGKASKKAAAVELVECECGMRVVWCVVGLLYKHFRLLNFHNSRTFQWFSTLNWKFT